MNTVKKDKQFYACPHGSSITPVRPARKPSQVIGYRVVPYLGNQSRQILSQDEMWFTSRVHAMSALRQGIQDDVAGSTLQLFVYDKSTEQWHYDGNLAYNWKN